MGGMWHADTLQNSLITTGNGGTTPTYALLRINFSSGSYYIRSKLLAPGEQLWVDVGDLKQSQLPDAKGNVIPLSANFGTYQIQDLNDPNVGALFEAKLTVDKTFGHAAYGCAVCCGDDYAWLDPDPFYTGVGSGGQEDLWGSNECFGTETDRTFTSLGWTSTNTAVATMGPAKGWVNGISAGTSTISAYFNARIDDGTGRCALLPVEGSGPGTVQKLGSFSISVTSTPVTGETNSVLSGQSAQVTVKALDILGVVMTPYRGTVHFSSTDTHAILPSDYTFTASDAGVHVFNVTLKTVVGTGPMRDLTAADSAASISSTQNVYVWWYVFMDVEFWKNCGFVSCPSLGSYYCQTAYKSSGYSQPTPFLAVTASSSSLFNQSVTVRNGSSKATSFIGDAGPVLNQAYWNTGNTPPSTAGCLSDSLATSIGITNGCNAGGPYGSGSIYWRFGN
jgi:hypothetical protein